MLDQYRILKEEKEQERQRQRVYNLLLLNNAFASFLSYVPKKGFFSVDRAYIFSIPGPEEAPRTVDGREGSTFWIKTKSNKK